MKRIIAYVSSVINELKKVVWPSPDSVVSSTKVVLVSIIIMAVFLGAIDFITLYLNKLIY